MKINKLLEDVDKNGNPIGYGAKLGKNKTVVFGPYKENEKAYSVNVVSNQGIPSGSHVCFKTIEEFENFKNTYRDDIQLVKKQLGSEVDNLIEVDTIYGKAWMRPQWYKSKPPVDARKLNKLIKDIHNKALEELPYSKERDYDYITHYLSEVYLKDVIDDIKDGLLSEFDISLVQFIIQSKYLANRFTVSLTLRSSNELDDLTYQQLIEYLQKALGLELLKEYKSMNGNYQLIFDGEPLEKLHDKLFDKFSSRIDNLPQTVDDDNLWNIAKDKLKKKLKSTKIER